MNKINIAAEKFARLIEQQLERVAKMNEDTAFLDYAALPEIRIGTVGGDGIGPAITAQAQRVLEFLLADEVKCGKVKFVEIKGLTIENRVEKNQAIPDDVLAELKTCHVILKGPTTTPQAGDPWPNIESANVAMRKALDLFANVRPVRVPEAGIDWTFFRENTEGAYAVGSQGVEVDENLAIDFTVTTTEGSKRIIRSAFEYARQNKKTLVTAVTKANVIKTTDGKFLRCFHEIARDYPGIHTDEWYIDIMTAKLIDKKRRGHFQVLVMPNLYGDILTDEAAEFQGGVGTAGSANIGKRYAMFEAIHGSAPRMVKEGRDIYADPSSMMRAAIMLLNHMGYEAQGARFETALDICTLTARKHVLTGRSDGATNAEFADYVMETIQKL
ncbi:MAG: isocitrate/isopropylmalate family dehydrogenase [Oscillospiraceae bacterium]|nr:isocitrate/isopropylmalate family dehydrogenase [Oscillospiraceae bacterium]